MIDSHTHSKFSKHAIGTIEDVVLSSIKNRIKYLTITDHAPFLINKNNRLFESELKFYFEEIDRLQLKYKNEITILKGLEIDFVPKYRNYTENLISNMNLDFAIGSIHFIFLGDKRVNIWDIKNLNNNKLITEYFLSLKELIQSNLFDTIGHPDAILRGGINEKLYYDNFYPLIELMKNHNISYELNTSGLRKSTYNVKTKKIIQGVWNFPSKLLISTLNNNNISFTIGSDSHKPNDVSKGIPEILKMVKNLGVKQISYYKKRKIQNINISDVILKEFE